MSDWYGDHEVGEHVRLTQGESRIEGVLTQPFDARPGRLSGISLKVDGSAQVLELNSNHWTAETIRRLPTTPGSVIRGESPSGARHIFFLTAAKRDDRWVSGNFGLWASRDIKNWTLLFDAGAVSE